MARNARGRWFATSRPVCVAPGLCERPGRARGSVSPPPSSRSRTPAWGWNRGACKRPRARCGPRPARLPVVSTATFRDGPLPGMTTAVTYPVFLRRLGFRGSGITVTPFRPSCPSRNSDMSEFVAHPLEPSGTARAPDRARGRGQRCAGTGAGVTGRDSLTRRPPAARMRYRS